MKKTLAIIATACAAASFAYAQDVGAVIIENVSGAKILPINLSDGTQVKGSDYKAGLWYKGAQVGDWYAFANNGRFTSGGGVEVGGTKAGDTVNVTVRAWDTRSGADYTAASIKGESPEFASTLGGGSTPPPKLVNMPTFALSGAGGPGPGPGPGPTTPTPTGVIPEPSTIALGILGAAALLFRLRK
jgi:hypothetical protein